MNTHARAVELFGDRLITGSAAMRSVMQAATGSISGSATGANGQVLANTNAQLCNITTKQLVGATTTNAQGGFFIRRAGRRHSARRAVR